jgi:AraC family transcriptional regulator of adaptative response / DNA-3-methyladenine glycosylase II
MTLPIVPTIAWHRAVDRRDSRFDGVFFVGITSTRVYCRPVCPSRAAKPENRRFFSSAGAAERSGFRACLRCRPDLAPGKAPIDAVTRLARAVARRIADGALNGRSISALAGEFGVSTRHVRRAVEREFGVPPRELALAHRLQAAQRLIVQTSTPVIQVAYASGFQSLRRFNAAFRACYRASPTEVRRALRA